MRRRRSPAGTDHRAHAAQPLTERLPANFVVSGDADYRPRRGPVDEQGDLFGGDHVAHQV